MADTVFPLTPAGQRLRCANYRAVDSRYGTMDDLDELIREADKRGIGLMLDMVFNHTSTEHEWFQKALAGDKKYQDYYIFKDGSPRPLPHKLGVQIRRLRVGVCAAVG